MLHKIPPLTSNSHLEQLNGKDKRLWTGLKLIQVSVAERVVGVDLSDAAAVPLAFQGVLTSTDVPQRLRHQRVQRCMLSGEQKPLAHETGWLPFSHIQNGQLSNLSVAGKFRDFALSHGGDHSLPHS